MAYWAEERYRHDAEFKALVDSMLAAVVRLQYSPSEMRDAAMLACVMHEARRVSPPRFRPLRPDEAEPVG